MLPPLPVHPATNCPLPLTGEPPSDLCVDLEALSHPPLWTQPTPPANTPAPCYADTPIALLPAVSHLQGLQAAVPAPVVHGNADGGGQLLGDASLLQSTHRSSRNTHNAMVRWKHEGAYSGS